MPYVLLELFYWLCVDGGLEYGFLASRDENGQSVEYCGHVGLSRIKINVGFGCSKR
jgi:hypothetical protein